MTNDEAMKILRMLQAGISEPTPEDRAARLLERIAGRADRDELTSALIHYGAQAHALGFLVEA